MSKLSQINAHPCLISIGNRSEAEVLHKGITRQVLGHVLLGARVFLVQLLVVVAAVSQLGVQVGHVGGPEGERKFSFSFVSFTLSKAPFITSRPEIRASKYLTWTTCCEKGSRKMTP